LSTFSNRHLSRHHKFIYALEKSRSQPISSAARNGAGAYTEVAETSDHGYPVLEHVKRLVYTIIFRLRGK
jgi:hypothetical protein